MKSTHISILLLTCLVVSTHSTPINEFGNWGHGVGARAGLCNNAFGECTNYEQDNIIDSSDIGRRLMAPGRQRYISYAALAANNIPCNRRGNSYYNCNSMAKANPYSRGCSVITRCARDNS